MFTPISNNEKQFLLNNLTVSQIREEERSLEDYRKISIRKLSENGQVEVKIGKTLIISQIFAKLVSSNYNSSNKDEGILVFSVDSNHLKNMAEYAGTNEDLNEMRNKLSNLLDKTLRDSK